MGFYCKTMKTGTKKEAANAVGNFQVNWVWSFLFVYFLVYYL